MKSRVNTLKLQKVNTLLLVAIFHLLVSGFLYWHFGVRIVNDSRRYFEYADNLNSGFYFDHHNFWYFGYVSFIFIAQLISDNPEMIVLFQYLLSFVAVIFLYKTCLILYDNKWTAVIAAMLYIFIIEILAWNSYILPEAIYASAIVFSFYLLVKPNKKIGQWILAIVVVMVTCLVKPTGITLFASILMVLLVKLTDNLKGRSKYVLFFIAGVMVLIIINRMLHTYIIIENYLTGEIVYAISTLPEHPYFNLLSVEVPQDIYVPDPGYQPLSRLILFIFFNPLFILKLSLAKTLLFLLHIRPYWSTSHNIFVMVFLYPIYWFAAKNFTSVHTSRYHRIFGLTFFCMNILIIAFTTVDWDGRFLLPLLPLLFISGSKEIVDSFSRTAS